MTKTPELSASLLTLAGFVIAMLILFGAIEDSDKGAAMVAVSVYLTGGLIIRSIIEAMK